ncbi:MAG TPA: Na+/H+ antiporter subunit E [Azonexus sp.]|nr:Na+/H+ antiporter subunit E [Azonexus sp.]
MKRWLPFPFVSVLLLLFWLLINQTIDPAEILLGVCLAVIVPLIAQPLQPLGYPRLRRPLTIFRLLAMASVEIVRSCFNVGRIILFVKAESINSQFIRIPIDLRDPYGLAVLAGLINLTPGTVWVEILGDRHELALHVFDLHDAQWWVDTIKGRYEQPLIEIFE